MSSYGLNPMPTPPRNTGVIVLYAAVLATVFLFMRFVFPQTFHMMFGYGLR